MKLRRTSARCCVLAATICAATLAATLPVGAAAQFAAGRRAAAQKAQAFLAGLRTVATVGSTTPLNGDENPYAVVIAPVTAGSVHKGDVLVDNFNAESNKQGTGSTIMDVSPDGAVRLFAAVPKHLAGCPGGVGLTTAMTMLTTGWVVVGSTPSLDGTTKTAGAGCLIVLSSSGKVVSTITGREIDGPWDLASVDRGATATLLVTNVLIGVGAPGSPVVDRGDLVRVTLHQSTTTPPSVAAMSVVASGFPEQASAGAFVVGPTGVAVVAGTAYVADPLDNAIAVVPGALSRTSPVMHATKIASGGELHHPIAMVEAPNGDLLVTNGLNGDIVEVSDSGHQLAQVAIDPDPAQSPPGSGDLFGLAVSGGRVYFAKDDTNTLADLS